MSENSNDNNDLPSGDVPIQPVYDSERFMVLHLTPNWPLEPVMRLDGHTPAPALPRLGFEIVDKRRGREIYLDGAWAEHFGEQIRQWQRQMPSRQEVEDLLEGWAALAHQPIHIH